MTTSNDKSGSPLQPSKNIPKDQWDTLNTQLVTLSNDLYKLISCYHFYHNAIQSIFAQDKGEDAPRSTEWQYGLFLVDDWLSDAGDDAVRQVEEAVEHLRAIKAHTVNPS